MPPFLADRVLFCKRQDAEGIRYRLFALHSQASFMGRGQAAVLLHWRYADSEKWQDASHLSSGGQVSTQVSPTQE